MMKYRKLGQTGLEVSEIGLGAFPISGMQRQADGTRFGWTGTVDSESIALIHRCEELGINLIDTAEGYGEGHSEVLVGRALRGRRDRWIVASKVQPNAGIHSSTPDESAVRKRITEACERSLDRLGMEYIDIYQLHAIPYDWAMPTVMDTLAGLRREGKVRWYGISTNDRRAVDRLRLLGPVHILQVGYNLLERTADGFLHWAKAENIGTLIRVPLAKGQLTGKYFGEEARSIPENDVRYERFNRPETVDGLKRLPQLLFLQNRKRTMAQAALRFVLDHPGVSCVIAGAKNRRQAEENARAVEMPPLTDAELERAIPIADTIGTPGWI
jgi:aryl-alcohol dehydrogenase-like predicted oxidoreductase